MISLIAGGLIRQVHASGRWMAWNVALALAPWLLSLLLFRPCRRPGAAWLCGALTCLLLMPNVPWTVEVPVHFLSAVAIYVGRIHRLNSWDIARQPAVVLTQALAGMTRPLALVGIATMFIALTLGQALSRPLLQAAETAASRVATLLGWTPP